MKKLLVMMIVFCFVNLAACSNTMSGLGKDMEQAGDSIKKSVKRLEKKLEDKEASEGKD